MKQSIVLFVTAILENIRVNLDIFDPYIEKCDPSDLNMLTGFETCCIHVQMVM